MTDSPLSEFFGQPASRQTFDPDLPVPAHNTPACLCTDRSARVSSASTAMDRVTDEVARFLQGSY